MDTFVFLSPTGDFAKRKDSSSKFIYLEDKGVTLQDATLFCDDHEEFELLKKTAENCGCVCLSAYKHTNKDGQSMTVIGVKK